MGELFGIEYLYHETNKSISALEEVDVEIDKGVMEDDYALDATPIPEESGTSDPELDFAFEAFNCSVPSESEIEEDEATSATDWNGVPGWDKVVELAVALVNQKTGPVNNLQADSIISLYNNLTDYDKKPLSFHRHLKPTHGRFSQSKATGGSHVGVEAMRRCFISAGSPSHSPKMSRIVEAICINLSLLITTPDKNPYKSIYSKIVLEYNLIRERIMNCPMVVEKTGLALYQINETTLSLW